MCGVGLLEPYSESGKPVRIYIVEMHLLKLTTYQSKISYLINKLTL